MAAARTTSGPARARAARSSKVPAKTKSPAKAKAKSPATEKARTQAVSAPAPPAARVDVAGDREPALEAAILAQPDERAPLLVYADWLQARQQPLGEVIALAIAAEDEPPRQRKLKVNATRALTAYIEQHLAPRYPALAARMLAFKLGPTEAGPDGLGDTRSGSIYWRRGLVDSIGTWRWTPAMREALFELLRDRHAMLLRSLSLRDHAVSELGFVAHLAALEVLELRWAKLDGLADLAPLAGLPRLAVVDLRASAVTDLTPLAKLPLRKLVLEGCPVADLSPLASHPTLECLDVGNTRVADVGPLLGCPRLCNVSLWEARVKTADADALVRAIRQHGAAPSPGADYEPYVSHETARWYAS